MERYGGWVDMTSDFVSTFQRPLVSTCGEEGGRQSLLQTIATCWAAGAV
jgi:hypothetical protein